MQAARAAETQPTYDLRNADGDRIGHYTDPVEWAKAYLDMWQSVPSDEEADVFASHNEATLSAVSKFPEAAALFDNGDDETDTTPQAGTSGPPEPEPELTPQQRKDRKRVSDRKADLAAISKDAAGRKYFDLLVGNTAIRATMQRLRSDEPQLFAEIEAEFDKKHRELPPKQEGLGV
jgi:hypothetical protein